MKKIMRKHYNNLQSSLVITLTAIILLEGLIVPIRSQEKPIVISFGQPNIWSLEQAHYLLARMHRQNLDLKTASLRDLDPNAINATRIEILRTMLSLGISFDDAVRVNNRLLRDNKNFNSQRRRQLLTERDNLQRQSNQLAREIAELQIAKANANTDEERDKLEAIIQAKTGLKAEYDNRISAINTELSDLSSPSGDFQGVTTAPDGFDPGKLPTSVLDELIKSTTSQSSIAASMKLQNHIDMQYEIISKQLTLLRDEVGPGERLVFLELPQSFNTSQDRAENKIAQVWWRIAGYTKVDRDKLFEEELKKIEDKLNKLNEEKDKLNNSGNKQKANEIEKITSSLNKQLTILKDKSLKRQIESQRKNTARLLQGGPGKTCDVVEEAIKLIPTSTPTSTPTPTPPIREYVPLDGSQQNDGNLFKKRCVRTIDIIPRQNALNVNDKKERVKATGIVAAFSFLFGLGGKFGYQRQSENLSEFVQQELYTSGFGKGDKDFGWNFYPFPGTKQIAPGVRSTYAVVIIPEDAETIALKAKGCYFNRKDYQLNNYDDTRFTNSNNSREASCSDEQAYIIPVPGGSNFGVDFWVTKLWYAPNRQPGQRLVASIYGENFSSQLGVLVDGIPLTQSVGLAQPSVESLIKTQLEEDSKTANPNCGSETICGRFERVDSKQIVISFNVPENYEGTPVITLIAPGTAVDINKLDLNINGDDDVKLDDADWMFGSPPQQAARAITDFKVYPSPVPADPNRMRGVIYGRGFKFDVVNPANNDRFFINGQQVTCTNPRSDFCIATFSDTNTESFTVTVVPADDKESVSKTFANPNTLKITGTSVIKLEVDDKQKAIEMIVRIDGSGFNQNRMNIRVDGCRNPETLIIESGQLILKLPAPEAVIRVSLTDISNNRTVSAVVTQPDSKTVVLKPSGK